MADPDDGRRPMPAAAARTAPPPARSRPGCSPARRRADRDDRDQRLGHALAASAAGSTASCATSTQMLAALKTGLGADWANTLVVVATEFGRTAAPNGTGGTDHGTASVAMLLGGAVAGGRVIADWPGLGDGRALRGPRPQADHRPRRADRRRVGAALPRSSPARDADPVPRQPRKRAAPALDQRLTSKRLYFLNFWPRSCFRGVSADNIAIVRCTCVAAECGRSCVGAHRALEGHPARRSRKRASDFRRVRQYRGARWRQRCIRLCGQRRGPCTAAVDGGKLPVYTDSEEFDRSPLGVGSALPLPALLKALSRPVC